MTRWAYEIHVIGRLSDGVTARIQSEVGDVVSTTQPVRTLIRGSVADQAALVGLLNPANRCEQCLACNE